MIRRSACAAGETERDRRLHLSLVDGLDAGAEDLAEVRAVADGHGDDRGKDVRHLDDFSQRVVDVEDLHEQRDAADDFHVDRRDPVDDRHPGDPAQSRNQARRPARTRWTSP